MRRVRTLRSFHTSLSSHITLSTARFLVSLSLSPGGGDQHDPPRAPEAPVSKDQNSGHQHDPVGGHPPHPQRRVHVLPVPQHRSGWLNSLLHRPEHISFAFSDVFINVWVRAATNDYFHHRLICQLLSWLINDKFVKKFSSQFPRAQSDNVQAKTQRLFVYGPKWQRKAANVRQMIERINRLSRVAV